MLWLGLSSLVLAVCVVVLAIMLLSIARQIGVLHERTQPMASRLQTMEVQEGDALEGLELPVQAEQGVEVTLLFVSTACPVCRSLHGSFAELMAVDVVKNGYWVFPMDDPQSIKDYARTHQIPSSKLLPHARLASQCAVTKTPTLVRLRYFDDNWRLLLRRPIDRAQQLPGLLAPSSANVATTPMPVRGAHA